MSFESSSYRGGLGLLVGLLACQGSDPAMRTAEPTPVGEVAGIATEDVIGAEGGTIVNGVLTIVIPPGALTTDTNIRVEPITNTAWGGVGTAYRLSPEDQSFLQPVELRFGYDESDIEGTAPEALRIAYQDPQGFWQSYDRVNLDVDARMLSVATTHFSDWARVTWRRIAPPSSTLGVTQRLALMVETCLPDEDDPAAELSAMAPCSPILDLDADGVMDWSVNGVPNGDDLVGRVFGDAATAEYTAPRFPPMDNPVRVTARVLREPDTMLTASVFIGGGGGGREVWRGTVTTEIDHPIAGGNVHQTVTANVVFEGTLSEFGGTLMLTATDYEADYLLSSSGFGGCRTRGTESGPLPASGFGTLGFHFFPSAPSTYDLNVSISEAYDGSSNCNDSHNDTPADDFEVVPGVFAQMRPFDRSSSTIIDTFAGPALNGGTETISVNLTKR